MTVSMIPPDSSGIGLKFWHKVLGLISLLMAVCLIRMMSLATLISALAGLKPVRTATVAQAEVYVRAIMWAGNFYPGRVACLERTIGVGILAALTRKAVVCCIGARFRPNEFHAWIEIDSNPVLETDSANWPYVAAVKF